MRNQREKRNTERQKKRRNEKEEEIKIEQNDENKGKKRLKKEGRGRKMKAGEREGGTIIGLYSRSLRIVPLGVFIAGSTGTVYTASTHNTHYPSRCNHTIGWLSEPGLSRTSVLCSRRFDSSEEK